LVSQQITTLLHSRAEQFGLLLDDISITHLTFGQEFTNAVEMKVVAQQEAEKARFLVEKAEQYKRAAIIAAEGDAKAAELIAKALTEAGEGLVELRRIEIAEDVASKLAQSPNITYINEASNMLLNMAGQR
jgi:prohibitin 1